jgi:hydroxypyruvate isomerase
MMFTERAFLDRFDAAAEVGFAAVEFLFPYDHPPEAIAERLERNRLTQALFNLPPGRWDAGERGLAALPGRFGEFKSGFTRALDYVAATKVKRVHMMAGNASRKDVEAEASYRRAISYAAPIMAERGVDLVLEPINRRNMPDYFLNDFAYTSALIDSLSLSNVKLQFDVYHRQILHGDVMAFRALQPIRPHPGRAGPIAALSRMARSSTPVSVRRVRPAGLRRLYRVRHNPAPARSRPPGLSPTGGSDMPLLLGAVADDYTGASDLANTLHRNGLATIQTIRVPASGLKVDDAEAIVVALKIRSVEASQAVEAATAAYDWLSARGAKHVMYKVCSTFDSTDAGNIGPVADALRATSRGGCALVKPAFPEPGRTVYLGHLFVGSTPLNESPLKDHPLNPMHDSNLVRVLQRQSKGSVGLIDLMTVEQGSGAVSRARAELSVQGYATAIVDAVFERDLEALGDAAAEKRVLCRCLRA